MRALALALACWFAVTDADAALRGVARGSDRAERLRGQKPGGTAYDQAVIEMVPTPTAFWPLYEVVGSATVADYTGGYQGDVQLGAVLGNASLCPDGAGTSLDVDEATVADLERINVPDNAALEIGGTWTVQFYFHAGTCGTASAIYDKDTCGAGGRFIIYSACGAGPDCVMHVFGNGSGNQDRAFTTTNDVQDGLYMVTSNGSGTLQLYVNGVFHDDDTVGWVAPAANTAAVSIGHRGLAGCSEAGCADERIQGVAVWIGTVLTTADALRMYNAGASAP